MQNKVKMVGTCVAGLLMSAIAVIKPPAIEPGEMRLSQEGYEMLLELESCRLEPYKCSASKWTDGVGNTIGVDKNKKITEQEAAADLVRNVARFEKAVNQSVKTEMTQPVFDSMVLLSFNIGVSAFNSSTALKQLNKGDFALACKWILPWNKITIIENGIRKKVVSPGLQNRRTIEYNWCMKGVAS